MLSLAEATCALAALLQNAMKDGWLNLGFLGDELRPYVEPKELIDEKRVGNYFWTFSIILLLPFYCHYISQIVLPGTPV